MFLIFLFLLSLTALNQDIDTSSTDRIVCLTERTGRLVLIDLKAYERSKTTIELLNASTLLKDQIIIKMGSTIFLTEGKVENEKQKNSLLVQEVADIREVNIDLNKKLRKSKKSKIVLIGLGLASGVVLGVLLTN